MKKEANAVQGLLLELPTQNSDTLRKDIEGALKKLQAINTRLSNYLSYLLRFLSTKL